MTEVQQTEHICKNCAYFYDWKGIKKQCTSVDNYETVWTEDDNTCEYFEPFEENEQAVREGGDLRTITINSCKQCSECRSTKTGNICILDKSVKPTWECGVPGDCPLPLVDTHTVKLQHYAKKGVNQTLDCF